MEEKFFKVVNELRGLIPIEKTINYKDLQNYESRVKTFSKVEWWFAKESLPPRDIARFGWILSEKETLACDFCISKIILKDNLVEIRKNGGQSVANMQEFTQLLKTAHSTNCRWNIEEIANIYSQIPKSLIFEILKLLKNQPTSKLVTISYIVGEYLHLCYSSFNNFPSQHIPIFSSTASTILIDFFKTLSELNTFKNTGGALYPLDRDDNLNNNNNNDDDDDDNKNNRKVIEWAKKLTHEEFTSYFQHQIRKFIPSLLDVHKINNNCDEENMIDDRRDNSTKSTTQQLQYVDTENFKIILSIFGWRFVEMKVHPASISSIQKVNMTLQCDWCHRTVGIWNFKTVSDCNNFDGGDESEMNVEDEELLITIDGKPLSNAIIEIYNSIRNDITSDSPFQSLCKAKNCNNPLCLFTHEGITDNQRSSVRYEKKRKLETKSSYDSINNRLPFDPIRQHRHYCNWFSTLPQINQETWKFSVVELFNAPQNQNCKIEPSTFSISSSSSSFPSTIDIETAIKSLSKVL